MKNKIIISLVFISFLTLSCREKFDFTTVKFAGTEWRAEDANIVYTLSFAVESDSCTLVTDCKAGNCYKTETFAYELGNPDGLFNMYLKTAKSTHYVGLISSKNTLYLTAWENDRTGATLPKFVLK
ncbi:MAG: hypothetical protein LBN23_01295 [Paludibacter sp.]|jgi:hypothetical protein|nr:hypothetical protein [Paludibacter sp.]